MINLIRAPLDVIQGKARKGEKRSGQWPKVRKEHLKIHGECQACGRNKKRHLLEVHHIIPFQYCRESELDHKNLITLCRRCHLFVGHLNNWKRFNVDIFQDAYNWWRKIKGFFHD